MERFQAADKLWMELEVDVNLHTLKGHCEEKTEIEDVGHYNIEHKLRRYYLDQAPIQHARGRLFCFAFHSSFVQRLPKRDGSSMFAGCSRWPVSMPLISPGPI